MAEKNINFKVIGIYYMLGNLFNKGVAFLTIPIFTRIMPTNDYGILTTYNSWVGIIAMFIGFAMHMGIRMAFVDFKEQIDDFMATVLSFTVEMGVIVCLLVVLFSYLFHTQISVFLILICLGEGIGTAIIEDFSMYLMMKYKYKGRTALMVLPNLFSIIFSLIAIYFFLNNQLYLGKVIPTATISIVIAVFIVILFFLKSNARHNWRYLKYALSISAPLVFHGIALNILSQSDRTMITWLANPSQTAIYGLIYNFSMLATVITSALEGVWTPWFMEKYKKRDFTDINDVVIYYTKFVTFVMIGLILVGPEIVKILASKQYWEGIVIVPPVVLANYFIFLYTFYVNVEHFNKKTLIISLHTVLAAIINIVLNLIFIPQYGYIAAAYTTLASYFFALILHARYAKRLERELYPIKTFVPSLIQILVAIVFFYCFCDELVIRWCGVIVYTIILFIRNKEKLITVIGKK